MDPSALASMDLSLVIKPLEDTITTLREENARLITMIDGFSARADRAEQALVAERSRADTLHDRLDATQDDLRQAREAADQAKHHAREAEDAIKSLRQADEERKARGRWARLRAAWRGQ